MCVQCGCINDPSIGLTYESSARESGQKKLETENASLKARVRQLEFQMGELWYRFDQQSPPVFTEPAPPAPEEGEPYHQPGVSW